MKLDLARCLEGMKKIEVRGVPNTDYRKACIEEAIREIQLKPLDALREQYIGIKNYAAFGDQREDHQYGMGPRHGSIVFSIGRVYGNKNEPLDADCIYFLECWRDFGTVEADNDDPRDHRNTIRLSLPAVIQRYQKATEQAQLYGSFLEREVEPVSESVSTSQAK